ncbi:DUF3888 domain-containing protein [Paenibacillus taichungensis]|uniref:DUF3888 domain-containing protein n=1 Tax=Paenibacillus taichungensis TaxID=484184 RepID=A0ABX2MNR4_9BACL|nr:DUF3888 domain-containing protein [Paenibacillus taichungensis]NUU55695.1 DUF3888 domain-containing protein [Paenibacillus taichungensis]
MRNVLCIFVICILTLNLNTLTYAEPNTVNEEEFKPLSLTLLNPSIQLAITQYYQKIQKPQASYGLYDMKVLELQRKLPGSYAFRIVVEVSTYYGPHNSPNAKEFMTFDIDPGKVKLIQYIHRNE